MSQKEFKKKLNMEIFVQKPYLLAEVQGKKGVTLVEQHK